jgi:hypothetical protein
VVSKQLAAASANNIALSQTPVSGTLLTLNGAAVTAGVATLDASRRVLITYGNEAAPRQLVLTGTWDGPFSQISETVNIPAGAAGTIASYFDYFTISSALPLGGGWTAAVTLGTNTTGSTQPQIFSHYQAIFTIGVDVTNPGGATWEIDCTRDVPYALPNIYTSGMGFTPPQVNWFAWPTLTGQAGTDVAADIDSPVWACRLTVTAGTSLVSARFLPVGLRT